MLYVGVLFVLPADVDAPTKEELDKFHKERRVADDVKCTCVATVKVPLFHLTIDFPLIVTSTVRSKQTLRYPGNPLSSYTGI